MRKPQPEHFEGDKLGLLDRQKTRQQQTTRGVITGSLWLRTIGLSPLPIYAHRDTMDIDREWAGVSPHPLTN